MKITQGISIYFKPMNFFNENHIRQLKVYQKLLSRVLIKVKFTINKLKKLMATFQREFVRFQGVYPDKFNSISDLLSR